MKSPGTAIFLCDITGKMGEPWLRAGYRIVLVDPQHPAGINVSDDGMVVRIGDIITGAMGYIGNLIRAGDVVFVMGFPPCTEVAVSGARWWDAKRAKDPYFQAKAATVAEQCRTIGVLSGKAWAFENPVSAFSHIFGKPQHTFHPHHFTRWCANDNYTKKTCLWTGGGFVMPAPEPSWWLGAPDNRIHDAQPGPERANFRSATPIGFARAVFRANAPHLKPQPADHPVFVDMQAIKEITKVAQNERITRV
jgi:hypothetical protein